MILVFWLVTKVQKDIFYNQIGDFGQIAKYELNLQNVKGDNYLKTHNLAKTSNIILDENILASNFDIDWRLKDSKLNTSFKIFEDLSRNYHDRYQYIFPDFKFYKNIDIPENYNGRFNFNSYGFNKNYDTNITESVITNDFLFKSNEFVNSKGIISSYNLLLKNSNSYANNSVNFEENSEYNLFGTIKIDASLPLKKKSKNFINYFKPIISARYSPNGNKNLSDKDIFLNYDSVFNLNRIGTNHEVEGGESLSFGFEYKKDDIKKGNIFDFKIASVIKPKENVKLPIKSKLNKTRSDIFGNFNYNFDNNFRIGYFFSYDADLEHSNLDGVNLDFRVNNFFNNFYYYAEDNELVTKETIQNNSDFIINEQNKFSFNLAKNLQEDFTQYYDFIYEYINDCISLSLNYNKSFYKDGNLEPNKSISFLIKIIPFTDLGVSNIGNIIKK